MNCTNRITAWGAMSVMAIAGCLLYAMSAVATNNEGGTSNTTSECQTAWDSAPASSYCTTTQPVTFLSYGSGQEDICLIAASCSITVDITYAGIATPVSTTFTPTFPSDWSAMTGGIGETDTDDIDICFAESASGDSYNATVKTGCSSGEITSGTASDSGLTLDNPS